MEKDKNKFLICRGAHIQKSMIESIDIINDRNSVQLEVKMAHSPNRRFFPICSLHHGKEKEAMNRLNNKLEEILKNGNDVSELTKIDNEKALVSDWYCDSGRDALKDEPVINNELTENQKKRLDNLVYNKEVNSLVDDTGQRVEAVPDNKPLENVDISIIPDHVRKAIEAQFLAQINNKKSQENKKIPFWKRWFGVK